MPLVFMNVQHLQSDSLNPINLTAEREAEMKGLGLYQTLFGQKLIQYPE